MLMCSHKVASSSYVMNTNRTDDRQVLKSAYLLLLATPADMRPGQGLYQS
jgi:hypothetical protein